MDVVPIRLVGETRLERDTALCGGWSLMQMELRGRPRSMLMFKRSSCESDDDASGEPGRHRRDSLHPYSASSPGQPPSNTRSAGHTLGRTWRGEGREHQGVEEGRNEEERERKHGGNGERSGWTWKSRTDRTRTTGAIGTRAPRSEGSRGRELARWNRSRLPHTPPAAKTYHTTRTRSTPPKEPQKAYAKNFHNARRARDPLSRAENPTAIRAK